MLIYIDINNMKKFYFIPVFILTGIIFQFSSCDEKLYTVLIKNESSKPVSYVYNGETDSLGTEVGVDNSKEYTVGSYTQSPKDINIIKNYGDEVFNETMTIKMGKHEENVYTFIDSNEIILSVNNTLPIEIVLKADKYIYFEYIKNEDNGEEPIIEILTEMRIPAYKLKTGKIYTATPNFTLFPSNYTVDWKLNEERTAINATIKNNVE
jgi:hypothetical protein